MGNFLKILIAIVVVGLVGWFGYKMVRKFTHADLKEYSAKNKENTKNFTDLIEKGNYVEARKLVDEWNNRPLEKITRAQVADLVSQGNFDMAAQVANEDKGPWGESFYYTIYYEFIFDNLTKIYNEQGESRLLYALSSMSYPVNEEDDGYIKYSNGRLE